ncbi:MAG TPA: Gfo/Idh/MocA family oxidoreductase [Acidimicrobiia bacterium]|nr:Gfo/Idh/MocA family oxidoreductase [Acidimicrobiia bacterium]
MTAPVRVAVVGAGAMGTRHARVIHRNGRSRVAVVMDIHRDRAQKLAADTGCRATDRLETALDCDAAVIATPADRHTEAAVAFLEAGKPVLVEKPLAENLAGVHRILAVSERRGVPVLCGFVERFNPAVVAAASLLAEPPRRMLARRQSPPRPHIRTSVVHDLLIHDVDLAVGFAGGAAIERISPGVAPPGRVAAEAAGCGLDFVGGAVATLSADRCSPDRIRMFTIETESEVIELDLARRWVTAYGRARRTNWHWPTPAEGDALDRQLDHFLDVVGGRRDTGGERHRLLAAHLVTTSLDGP